MFEQLIGKDCGALPEEIRPFLLALIEGRVKQYALVVEFEDGSWGDQYPIFDDDSHRYGMVGALEGLKRDYMISHIKSRFDAPGGD